MTAWLDNSPALVLNADYRPLSYYPLSLWPWREVVKGVFLERVDIVAEYEHSSTRATCRRSRQRDGCARKPPRRRGAWRLPSVISLKAYVPKARRPAFTRFNVFLRDSFSCQYCGVHQRSENLTFDHVVPRSRGGGTNWSNVVTACASCNLRKGNRTAVQSRMHPRNPPRMPTTFELQRVGRQFPPNYLHESWRDYLYWDTELQSE